MATGGVREIASCGISDDSLQTCELSTSEGFQTYNVACGEGGGEGEPVQSVPGEGGPTTEEKEETEEGEQEYIEYSIVKAECGETGVPGDGLPVVVLCPTWRRPVTLPNGGVRQLQANLCLEYVQADDTSRAISCELCVENRKQNATHACKECRVMFCQPCRREVHDRFPDSNVHHVMPLGQGDQRATSPTERKLCQSHPDHSLCYFCQNCDVIICLLCKQTSHEGHATVDLEVASAYAEPELERLKVKLNEQIRVLGSLLERLDNDERQLARKKQDVARQANTRYDVAVSWLTQAFDNVMHSLTSKEQRAVWDLRAEKKSARVAMETLQAAQSRANRAVVCGPEVLHVKTELQAVLLDDVTIRQHRERAAREAPTFFCQCVEGVDEGLLRDYIGHVTDGHEQVCAPVKNITTQLAQFEAKLTAVTAELAKTATEIASVDKENADLKTEVAALQAQAAADIAFNEKQNADLKNEMAALKDELAKTATGLASNDQLYADLKSEVAAVQAVLAETAGDCAAWDDKLTTTVDSLTRQLTSLLDKTQKTAVAFHARLNNTTVLSPGSTIIFDNVLSNMGDAYDPSSGFFTAPVTGTYLFLATVGNAGSSGTVSALIEVDGSNYARAHGSPESVGSSQAVVKLDAGKKVRVKNAAWTSTTFFCWDTNFSGVLISAA